MDINKYTPKFRIKNKDLLHLADLSPEEIFELLYTARSMKKKYKVGDKYTIKATDKYTNGDTVPSGVVGWTCTVMQVKSDSILLKEIYTWVKI